MEKHTVTHQCNIFSSKLNISSEYINLMVTTANELNYSFVRSDQNRARTDRKLWEETTVYDELLKIIHKNIDNIIRRDGNYFMDDFDILIEQAWIVKYQPNGSMHLHDHLPAHFSFIYYIQNTPGSPTLQFEGGLTFDGYQDHLILFPGYLKHQVIYKESADPRLSLVGNATFVLKS